MNPASRPSRLLSTVAIIAVALAPMVQLAHAREMVHEARGIAVHAAAHHHDAPAPLKHHGDHQHAATCCDLCPTGCQTVVGPPAAMDFASYSATHIEQPATTSGGMFVTRDPHFLPFSLPPPHTSV
jgi:hypothetical protein